MVVDNAMVMDGEIPEVYEKDCVQFYEDETLIDTGKLVLKDEFVECIGRQKNFKIDYMKINMHGVVKEATDPHLMVVCSGEASWRETTDSNNNNAESAEENGHIDNDDGEEQLILKFIPQSESELDEMYNVMCAKMSLHPDDNEDDSDLDPVEEDHEYMDADGHDEDDEKFGED